MRPRSHWQRTAAATTLLWAAAAPLYGQDIDRQDDRSSRVHYRIEVRVEDDTKLLEGSETITWTNHSSVPASDLWFHLYWNAYSNNLSTHLWESEGKLRGVEMEDGWGWQRVTSIRVGGPEGDELVDGLRFRAPDDGREDDKTVFSLDLAEPVAPGETLDVHVRWEAQIPRVRRRTGYKDGFLFLAHWFPKLGVFEGEDGWNCHQFHMNTEFYSNYGTYDVTIDLPAKYRDKVGASGVQVGAAVTRGNRVLTRFVAPSHADQVRTDPVARAATGDRPLVHAFTWTADPRYVVKKKTFQYDEWHQRYETEVQATALALGRSVDDIALRDVDVVVMIQPEREAQWERHYRATCTALFFYGLWWGEYPYERVTVVDPAWGARAAGGMEYPTIFTCGTRLFTEPEMYTPESVTVHEAGHQFWYGLVGNNEFEAAWLDEGFNSYTDSEALWREYGSQRTATWYAGLPVWGRPPADVPAADGVSGFLTAQRWRLWGDVVLEPLGSVGPIDWWRDQPRLCFVDEYSDPRWNDRARYLGNPDVDPVNTRAWEYVDRSSYSTNSYPRPAVVLRSLAGAFGRDAFLRGMRNYSEEWRYRHPYPEDFYRSFNEGAGIDASWYFDELFEGTGTVDWSIDVGERDDPEPRGMFLGVGENGGYGELDEAETSDEVLAGTEGSEDAEPDGEKKLRHYDVVVRRKGEVRLPVWIEVRFDDDSKERFEWTREMQDGKNWWRLPITPGRAKIAAAIVDPERLYYLDRNMSDNQWFEDDDSLAPLRWSERVLTQYSHLLHWFSSIGG